MAIMTSKKFSALGAVLTLSLGITATQGATVQYQLSDCNDSATCSTQYGNSFGIVTVTDVSTGVVAVNVDLAPNHTWVRTGLATFSYTLDPALAGSTPILSLVTSTNWTPISGSPLTNLNTDGMGAQQYGLDFEGDNDSVSADLDFQLTLDGLTAASFALGGVAADTGRRYYFLADTCTGSDGKCSNQTAQMTGPVGAFAPVPLPAAAWLCCRGSPDSASSHDAKRRKATSRHATNHSAAARRFIGGRHSHPGSARS
ncbi:MAG: hypothetical protein KA760_09390 [Steroidobacteraceae bacterium]|jgi:hypothetical protein|nr:hypothetical protein [Steroidobacteraceae bacterium]